MRRSGQRQRDKSDFRQATAGILRTRRKVKRLTRAIFVSLVFVSLAYAQDPQNALTRSNFEEPENHAITVARLMRYHDSGEYDREIREVANSARDYLESRFPDGVAKDVKIAAVFDIDETSLSNWDVMAFCGFCSYTAQLQLYKDGPYTIDHDAVIPPVLELYNFAKKKGIAVFFVTGRLESQRSITEANLREVGYSDWVHLYMQPDVPQGQPKPPARIFKPKNRQEIEATGYQIVLNIGDQASDLAGCCALRVFKVPNPFYLVP
jgi:predicted secreted acid phosphatase